MRLLVTGVAGFIGSNFVYHWLSRHPHDELIGLDSLTYAGNLENLKNIPVDQKERFTFIKGDICDPAKVREIFQTQDIDAIVNFAAESHVDRSIHDPQIFLRSNILGTASLLDAAREFWKKDNNWLPGKRFLQVSTDEVYGSLGAEGSFTEKTPLDPHSPYSASKASADLLVKAYHDTFGLPVLITRCSNNYGPYQFPEKLIPLMINNALQHKSLPIYGDGKQIRDWLYVDDHCRAIECVLKSGRTGEIYNVGGNNEKYNIDIVKLVISVLRQETGDPEIDESLIRFVQDRPGHDRRYAIDSSKIKMETGWKPQISFETGIRSTIRWYLDHRDWMQHVISGEFLKFYEKNYQKH
ncbi:MAG: dTDP-glucose 4,6-dehydratase [Methanoregula sp.]